MASNDSDRDSMDTIQKALNQTLENVPADILSDILDAKLRAQGIRLTKDKCKELATRILKEKVDELTFDADTELKDIVLQFTDADTDAVEARLEAFLEK